ncbi:MAG: hypothetical protein JW797_08890 [Bradymonadales bacterium]|nr:hypothetical protein [Bradymonadales bacterium]
MKKGLRILITILFIVIAGVYVLETQVLPGVLIYQADIHINEINPNTNDNIQVREAGGFVRVYLKAGGDNELNITVRDPSGRVVFQESHQVGKYNFRFDTPVQGNYQISLGEQPPDARLSVRGYQNDRRILSGLF